SSAMFEHPGDDILTMPWRRESVQSLQLRGEYLYGANGRGGLRVYDVADIDNKGIAERITTSVNSPLGQRFYVRTPDAAAVVSPSTLAVDPLRTGIPENEEQPVHPLYGYLYVLDRHEGLILVAAGTLLDGNPDNNFLERARLADGSTAFNPGGALAGATNGAIAGHYLYVCAERGLAGIDVERPEHPFVDQVYTAGGVIDDARAVKVGMTNASLFAYVADGRNGLRVIQLTSDATPGYQGFSPRPRPDLPGQGLIATYPTR